MRQGVVVRLESPGSLVRAQRGAAVVICLTAQAALRRRQVGILSRQHRRILRVRLLAPHIHFHRHIFPIAL